MTLDFYEPSDVGDAELGIGYAMTTGTATDLNSTGSRARITLKDGTLSGVSGGTSNSYRLDTSYALTMIFNDTNAAVAYAGGTLAAYSADVWLSPSGGLATFAGSLAATNSADTAYTFGFRSFTTQTQTMLVDNVLVVDGASTIPEPSTTVLGLLGACALLRRRR